MKGNRFVRVWAVLALLVSLGIGVGGASSAMDELGTEATVGTVFTYQGQLWDGSGPVNATCDLQFKLWDAASGGAQVGGTILLEDVLLVDGLFTARLDFGAEAFRGQARYLEVAASCPVGSAFVPLPRQELTASPYALWALGAPWTGLEGVPADLLDGDQDTTYTPGAGLVLEGTEFRVNRGEVQWRVSQTCAAGSSIRAIDVDGTVTCEVDDNTTYTPGTGLSLVGGQFSVNFGGTGSESTVARSDHSHAGAYWQLGGNAGTVPGTNYLGTSDNAALEIKVNGARALRIEPNATSPNLIGGYAGNWVTDGVYGATIGGGGAADNGIGDPGLNGVAARFATVAGGVENTASGNGASVGGGWRNTAAGPHSVVGGGWSNGTTGGFATVGGGTGNLATDGYSAVCGGASNTASGYASFVGGGVANSSSGDYGAIGGGQWNQAQAAYATIGGGGGPSEGDGNVVAADYATVGGGRSNSASAGYATVGGGLDNTAGGNYATVGGGEYNTASEFAATVGGGEYNTASDGQSTVGGGWTNTASGQASTVGGGYTNIAQADSSTVGGGWVNTASGNAATVPGGAENQAAGGYSFAAGAQAHATHDGSFVWSSGTATDSWGTQTFTVRSHGGARFYSAAGTATGVQLSAGGTSFASISDRNAKEAFAPVDASQLLEVLASMPVQTWNLKSQASEVRHIGPVAQDFNGSFAYLFGEVESPIHINNMDAVGVSLAASQGLYALSQEQAMQIAGLRAENATLRDQLGDLEARLAALESGQGSGKSAARMPSGWLLLGGSVLAAGVVVGRQARGGGR